MVRALRWFSVLPPEPRAQVEEEPVRGGEYARLQGWLLGVTLVCALAIGIGVGIAYSPVVAFNYWLGALGGILYLRMLSRGVAQLGKGRSRLGVTRFALFAALIIVATRIQTLQVLPIFFGFLTYKVTLLIYLIQTLVKLSRPRRSA